MNSEVAGAVFIVGCDRSGTTLLRLMLIQSRELYIPPESGFLPKLYENRYDYGRFTDPSQRWFLLRDLQNCQATSKTTAFSIFGLTLDEAEQALREAAPTDYAGAASALYFRAAEKNGKKRWGDKTPMYTMEIDFIASLFPSSRFVHILRDPRDVVSSIVKAGWKSSFSSAARHWVSRVEAGIRSGAQLGPARYRELRFEHLLEDPEHELRELCQWLGIEYSPRMLQFHRDGSNAIPPEHHDLFPLIDGPIAKSRAYNWRTTLSRQSLYDIEDVTRNLMKKVGYQPIALRTPLLRSTKRGILAFIHRLISMVRRMAARLDEWQ